MPPEAIYTVTEVYPSHVVLDGNHPLAGMALNQVKVIAVRPATDDENRGRAASPTTWSACSPTPPSSHLH